MRTHPPIPDANRPAAAGVRKRLVFYFSGFDPRGPSHYHTLYGEQAKLHTPLNGLDLSVGKRRRSGSPNK